MIKKNYKDKLLENAEFLNIVSKYDSDIIEEFKLNENKKPTEKLETSLFIQDTKQGGEILKAIPEEKIEDLMSFLQKEIQNSKVRHKVAGYTGLAVAAIGLSIATVGILTGAFFTSALGASTAVVPGTTLALTGTGTLGLSATGQALALSGAGLGLVGASTSGISGVFTATADKKDAIINNALSNITLTKSINIEKKLSEESGKSRDLEDESLKLESNEQSNTEADRLKINTKPPIPKNIGPIKSSF